MGSRSDRVDPSQSAAVLFGVETYPNTSLEPVPAAPRNTGALRRSFADPELWGLRGNHRLVVEADPPKADMLDAVANAARIPDDDGILLIYFVGHALYGGGTLYLAGSDANLSQTSTLLTMPELTEAAASSAAARKLLILDCCYSGAAAGSLKAETQAVNEAAGWLLIAATDAVPAQNARLDEEFTPFTAALLAGFEGSPGVGRSLSPRTVLARAATLLEGEPRTNHAAWEDDPWLRNRRYRPPPVTRNILATRPPASPFSGQRGLPGLLAWPERDARFVGRKRELQLGAKRVVAGGVLTVTGPLKAGKDHFADQLIAEVRSRGTFDEEDVLLGLEIPIATAEEPVLESLSRALGEHLDERDAIEPAAMASLDGRRRRLVTSLMQQVGDRKLLIHIDCTRLGPDPAAVRAELDTLLEDPYFRRAVTVVKARTKLDLTGDGQLRDLPPIPLGELSDDEAGELLGNLLDAEQIELDGPDLKAEVLRRLNDPLVRLPGVLVNGVDGFIADHQLTDTGELVASNLVDALLNRSVPTVLRALRDAGGLQLRQPSPTGHRHGPLAVLICWALTEGLPVSHQVLQSADVGFRAQIEQLTDARVLRIEAGDGGPSYGIGPASRNTLRLLLLVLLGVDESAEGVDSAGMATIRRTIGTLPGPEREASPDELDEALARAGTALQATISQLSPDRVPELVQAVRWAVGWIDENAAGRLPRLRDALSVINAYDGDAVYLSVVPERSASPVTVAAVESALSPETADLERLLAAAARLTVAARQQGTAAGVLDGLVRAASEVAEAIVACPADLVSYHLLKSVDATLFLAGRRLRSTTSLLAARERAADVLYQGAVTGGASRTDRVLVVLSWLLNTAEAQVDAGRRDQARGIWGKAEETFTLLPEARDTRQQMTRLQMEHRLGRLQARCADSHADRISGLRRAFARTKTGLGLSTRADELTLWCSRHIDTASVLALELRAADDQDAFVTEVLDQLTTAWQPYGPWPVAVRVAVWRFMHGTFRGLVETDRRLTAARRSLSLLLQGDAEEREGQQALLIAQVEAHLFLARTLRVNDQLQEALTEARRALSLAETGRDLSASTAGGETAARAYLLWLQALRTVIMWSPPRDAPGGARTQLKREAGIAQEWLRNQDGPMTRAHAMLDLWCMRKLWSEEGNLTVASAREGEDFSRLPRRIKEQRLEEAYRKRRRSLQGHERVYGPSIELCRMQVHLERQYQRWQSVIWRKDVDNSAVWALLRRAEDRWPHNPALVASIADFHRYIWEHGQAIVEYQKLVTMATNAHDRLRAVYGAVESAVTQAQYDNRLPGAKREQMLTDARQLLDDEIQERSLPADFALLRHRIALELDEEVDWGRVDRVFDEIIGDNYSRNIGRYLTTRRYGSVFHRSIADQLSSEVRTQLRQLSHGGPVAEPADGDGVEQQDAMVGEDESSSMLGELLLENFTDVDLLQALGSIYLRRADFTEGQHDATAVAERARRAFDCFDACRILQQDRTGNTPLVTKFLSGRAILLAAQASDDPDPFDWEAPPPHRNWIEYATSLLQVCKSSAVGGFGRVCNWRFKEANDVLTRLNRGEWPPR
ncbi:hypothetical protein O7600_25075 [Micromonospora sp. WMMA1998]|uniref:caspase family protein n=1 Tax=Micromonospora sp. WMMA1998 TaxID=3015167 RepID=UPI00248C18DF|nr:hypothetical protein [Micromonospora sp. WMMA1998]WBC14342.1 hypothetical protein O7600_25075 [Micromonospora sp. WMMA1998]